MKKIAYVLEIFSQALHGTGITSWMIYSSFMKGRLGVFSRSIWGNGRSVGRQYYYAEKRSEEKPSEYLYRLNVAAIRAKIRIMDGFRAGQREHA